MDFCIKCGTDHGKLRSPPVVTEIVATFRRRKETVKRRQGQGAPIAVDEGHYSAEYNALMHRLVQRGGAHPVKPS